jgi:hypothetical protein
MRGLMTQDDYARKLDELDILLNDPDVPMDPARVWSLLADLSGHDSGYQAQRSPRPVDRLGAMRDGGSAD